MLSWNEGQVKSTIVLLHCPTLRQISCRIHVAAYPDGDGVGEELERDDFEDGQEQVGGGGDFQDVRDELVDVLVTFAAMSNGPHLGAPFLTALRSEMGSALPKAGVNPERSEGGTTELPSYPQPQMLAVSLKTEFASPFQHGGKKLLPRLSRIATRRGPSMAESSNRATSSASCRAVLRFPAPFGPPTTVSIGTKP